MSTPHTVSRSDTVATFAVVVFFVGVLVALASGGASPQGMFLTDISSYQESLSTQLIKEQVSLTDVFLLAQQAEKELFLSTQAKEILMHETFVLLQEHPNLIHEYESVSKEVFLMLQEVANGEHAQNISTMTIAYAENLSYDDALELLYILEKEQWLFGEAKDVLTQELISHNRDVLVAFIVLYGEPFISDEVWAAAQSIILLYAQTTPDETPTTSQEDVVQEVAQQILDEYTVRSTSTGVERVSIEVDVTRTSAQSIVLVTQSSKDAMCRFSFTRTWFFEMSVFSDTGTKTHRHTSSVGDHDEVFVRCQDEETLLSEVIHADIPLLTTTQQESTPPPTPPPTRPAQPETTPTQTSAEEIETATPKPDPEPSSPPIQQEQPSTQESSTGMSRYLSIVLFVVSIGLLVSGGVFLARKKVPKKPYK